MTKKTPAYALKPLSLCIAAIIAHGFSPVTFAQEQQKKEEGKIIEEEIVVKGTSYDFRRALQVKRSSDIIVDSIVSSDIGKQPDQNIADSLARVTGVQIARARGQAEAITIRGLRSTFTQTLLNGRPIATAFGDGINSRGFEAYITPSVFTSRLDVHKTSKADIQEGGLAGSVNIVTQRAFDIGKRQINIHATGNLDSNNDGLGEDFVASYSDLFADETIGITLAANIVREEQGVQRSRGGSYDRSLDEGSGRDLNGDGDTDDENILIRRNIQLENYIQNRDRDSYLANIEWRPNDSFSLFGELFHSAQMTTSPRQQLRFDRFDRGSNFVAEDQETIFLATSDGMEREIVTQVHNTAARVTAENELQIRDADLTVGQLVAKFNQGKPWSYELAISRSESSQDQDRFRAQSRTGSMFDLTARFNLDDSPTDLILGGTGAEDLLNVDNYGGVRLGGGSQGFNILSDIEQTDFEFDMTRSFDSGFVRSVQFGVSYSENQFDSQRQNYNLNTSELVAAGVTDFNFLTVMSESGGFLDSSNTNQIETFLVPDVDSLLAQIGGAGAINETIDPNNFDANVRESIVDIDEEFNSAYAMVNFANEDDRLSGNFGIRYTDTKERSAGNAIDFNSGLIRLADGTFDAGATVPVVRSRSYSEVLPSLNLRYKLTDDQVLRFAALRTMTRPDPGDLDLLVGGLRSDEDGLANEISINDPNLDPFLADNLNLSYNWYYKEDSLFAVGLFHKELDSLIGTRFFDTTFNIIDEVTGEVTTENFRVEATSNVDGATIKGSEIVLQHSFSDLPGFWSNTGFKANFTYIDNSEPELLRAASRRNYNLVLFYDNGTLDFRTSYTFRGDFLLERAQSDETLPETFNETGFLNANLTYRINDNLRVRLSGRNLTDEADYRSHGLLVRQYIDFGKRFSLSVQASF